MGGVCTKDELQGSAFIKINSKEIQASRTIDKNDFTLSRPLNSGGEFKSSSYNLFDIQGFILPDTKETLLPLAKNKAAKSPLRRRSSEISVLQLPPENKSVSKSDNHYTSLKVGQKPYNYKRSPKKPTFSKAPPEHKKILNPPRFKALKRSLTKNNRRSPPLLKTDDKAPGKNSSTIRHPYAPKKKALPRKTFSYRSPEKKPSSKKLGSQKTDGEEKPLLLKDPTPILSPKLNKKRTPLMGRRALNPPPKESSHPKVDSKMSQNSSSNEWLTISLEKSSQKNKPSPRKLNNNNKLSVKSSSDPNLSLVKTHSIRNGRRHGKPPPPSSLLSKESSVSAGLDKPFTNISIIKSATHSVESNVSNFERRTKIESFPDKKTTLNEAGLGKELKLTNKFTQKDFKQKKEAYNEAMKQIQSGDWEKEIDGVNSLVSLLKNNPEIIKNNISMVVRVLSDTAKNLRSQVCRSGAQAFAELYLRVGRSMEGESDKIIPLLLNKAVDTNKFIREDFNTALDIAMENISVYKGLSALLETGVDHKNVVARINTSRIFSNIVSTMGAEKVMGSSKEFQTLVFVKGCSLLGDGSQEVRNHAKEAFRELSSHKSYSSTLKTLVPETQRRYIQKTLDSFQINQ